VIFDTGAVIGFEKGKRNVAALVANAVLTGATIHVPVVVVAEAWRGGARGAKQALLLAGCRIEPLHDAVARKAGEALATVRGATTIDAIVAACAHALRLPLVTADPDDMRPLAAHFSGLKLIVI
jgi:predicted nucleic acid-binding protein